MSFPNSYAADGQRLAAKRFIVCPRCGIKIPNLRGQSCRCGYHVYIEWPAIIVLGDV